ncbi:MAG: TraB/GumN family protein [Thermoplasmata archaeon]
MITLIGVGHVFAISEKVRQAIIARRPDVVCLELDPARYDALVRKDRRGRVPFQYRLLGYVQRRLAAKFGSEVGDEMLAAAAAAGEIGAKIALIDMDAARVFALLWRRMSFREKLRMFGGAFVGLTMSRERIEREMERYEEHEESYIEILGAGLPTVKEVLIDDRNRHMARNIAELSKKHANIVAVVGDGHIPGLLEALKPLEVEAVRLRDLRQTQAQAGGGAEFSSSFWYHYR